MVFEHHTFLSPFTWRYGSEAMRSNWSEAHKRHLWRQIWVALAEAQAEAGLVTTAQAADLRAHVNDVDIMRSHEIEAEIHHDLMAEIRCYAEQCPVGGAIIHLGATSADIEDNADALRLRAGLALLLEGLHGLLGALSEIIEREADHVCMAYTHLQPAEPTTVGYRLAAYGQDLLADYGSLRRLHDAVRGKGLKGAVGTGAAFTELLKHSPIRSADLEAAVMTRLGLAAYPVTGQTYPRRQDWEVLNGLAGLALTIYRLAFDVRLLQSPAFGEWSEPFAATQVGSSAMPFKRNPIHSENLDSLARYLAALPRVAWDNAAHSLLERTLDDSANRRLILPEAFLAADELLHRARRIVTGLRVSAPGIGRNMETYGVFAATERLLMAAAGQGGDRQVLHEVIREHSLRAWEAIQRGEPNPLRESLSAEPRITAYLDAGQVYELLNAEAHIGDAAERARKMAASIRAALEASGQSC